jgi:hypothetical protein
MTKHYNLHPSHSVSERIKINDRQGCLPTIHTKTENVMQNVHHNTLKEETKQRVAQTYDNIKMDYRDLNKLCSRFNDEFL